MTKEQLELALAGIQKLKKEVEKNELLLHSRIQKYLFHTKKKKDLKLILVGIRKLNQRVNRNRLMLNVRMNKYRSPERYFNSASDWLFRVGQGGRVEKHMTLSQLDGEYD
jgi:hypothetical protein